jgi:hypothetical protein
MRLNLLLTSLLLGVCACIQAAPSDPVLLWNAAFTAEMRRDTLAPAIMARNLALLHAALWEANTRESDPGEKACHVIGYKICSKLLPGHTLAFEKLLDEVYPERITDADRLLADACAQKTLSAVAADGSSSHTTYTARGIPGFWFRTPPFFRTAELPHWAKVKTLQIPHAAAFRPGGPPPLSSAAYATAWKEVRDWGGKKSALRTEAQATTARFWSDFSYTETPVGHWNRVARNVAESQRLSQRDTALLFHLLNTALADAAVACWDAKFTYDFWRPITAVRMADNTAQNPETIADPGWEPLLNTPNHPEYVSGHSAFSGAAGRILIAFFGTGEIAFEVGNDTIPAEVRKFERVEDCVRECSLSRIYGGIHFRFSCEDGVRLGEQVGAYIWEKNKSLRAGNP